MFKNIPILMFFLMSSQITAENYSIDDIANFAGISTGSNFHENCYVGNILEKYACTEATKYVEENLNVDFDIYKGEILYEGKIPNQKLSSKDKFVDGKIRFRLDVDKITLLHDDNHFSSVDIPIIGRLPFKMNVWGDGTVRHTTLDAWLFEIRTDYDVDISGSASVTALVGITLNPNIIYLEGAPTVVLEPKIRLLSEENSYSDDLKVDVDSSFFNLLANFIFGAPALLIESIRHPDLIFINTISTVGYIIVDAALLVDDVTGDSLFGKLNDELANHDLDNQSNRMFKSAEDALNAKLRKELNADSNGLVYIKSDASIGNGVAQLIAILNPIL